MTRRIILDLSRTLGRAGQPVPTGIDRVEMAYAEHLLAHVPDRLQFAALHPIGRWGLLPRAAAERLVRLVARHWQQPESDASVLRGFAKRLYAAVLFGGMPRLRQPEPSVYLLVSHHHLNKPRVLQAALARERAVLIAFVHDLIPIDYPEYGRPGEAERHQTRMESVAQLAAGIIVNSAATRDSLQPFLTRAGRSPPVAVAHLGVHLSIEAGADAVPAPAAHPVFACLGTIEPRKNHLLLLHLWRRMTAERGATSVPHLVIVGRRGWENENVIDMIERCGVLQGVVQERNNLPDSAVRQLLRSCRALLLPSFVEGYGLPLVEALGLGVPALCSDVPVFREVGGDVPEFLDPLDGPSWLRAIDDYTTPESPRRAAQLARLPSWQPPLWSSHLHTAMSLIDQIASGP